MVIGEDHVFSLIFGGVNDDQSTVGCAGEHQVVGEPCVADEVREVGLLHGELAQRAIRVAVHLEHSVADHTHVCVLGDAKTHLHQIQIQIQFIELVARRLKIKKLNKQ